MIYLSDPRQDTTWAPEGPPRPWGRAAVRDPSTDPDVQRLITEEQHIYERQTAMVAEADGDGRRRTADAALDEGRPAPDLNDAQRELVRLANAEGDGGGGDADVQKEMIQDAGGPAAGTEEEADDDD